MGVFAEVKAPETLREVPSTVANDGLRALADGRTLDTDGSSVSRSVS